jgi:outer membrane receptor protein involved in Fe transport
MPSDTRRSIAAQCCGLFRSLPGAALVLCVASGIASAQDSSPSVLQALDSLLNTPVNTVARSRSVVSTAAKYPQTTREVEGSVTIITAEDILRFGYRTLDEVLESMAGIYTSNDRNYSYIGVRGFGRPSDYNNRIVMLIDGHTTNESIWGSSALGGEQVINLQSVERIEVLRGPASVLYGTGAMFATVNVITRDLGDIDGGLVSFEAGAHGQQGGSVHFGRQLGNRTSVALSGLLEDASGADVYYPEFDDPTTNNGVAHDLDWERRAGIAVSGRSGPLSVRGRFGARSRGISTASFGMIFDDPRARTRDASGFLEAKFDGAVSETFHLTARGYFDGYSAFGAYPSPGDSNYSESGSHRVLGTETALHWDPVASNRVTVGAEYRWNPRVHYQIPADGPTTLAIDRPYSTLSLYAQDEIQLRSNLTLLLGLRHDESSFEQDATTPRMAIIYDPRRGTTFKAMYGTAFRAPSMYEAAFPDSAAGSLAPERLRLAELIWIQSLSSAVMVTSSVYHYTVEDLIDVVEQDSNSAIFAYKNIASVSANGIEISVDARVAEGTRGYLNYTWQRAEEASGANQGAMLTNSPSHLVKLGVAATVTTGLMLAVEMHYESSRATMSGTRTDAAVLSNANLVWRPQGSGIGHRLELSVRGLNLLNRRYGYPGGTEHVQTTIPQNGRLMTVRLGYHFGGFR